MKPILSIIIVSFNSRIYLDNCLESLDKSTFKKSTEVIIIDNNSSDGTDGLIKKKYNEFLFINNRQNLGFAKANNLGIKKSAGKYILLLNPDTIIPPNTLTYMVEFMDKNPGAGVATCFVSLKNGQIDDACHRGFPSPWNSFCHFMLVSRLFPNSNIFNGYHLGYKNLHKIHEIDSCAGAFMMIRRSVGEKLKFLDEDYFWYGEDLDFCYRVKESGFKVFFVPQVKIYHYKGVTSGIKKHSETISTASFETRYQSTVVRFEVMKIFYLKHYQTGINKILTPFIFAVIDLKKWLTLIRLKKIKYYAHRF